MDYGGWTFSLKEIFDSITYGYNYSAELPDYTRNDQTRYAEESIPPTETNREGEINEDHQRSNDVPQTTCDDQCGEIINIEDDSECSEDAIPATLPPIVAQKRRRSSDDDNTKDEMEFRAKRSHMDDVAAEFYQTDTPLTVQTLLEGLGGGFQEAMEASAPPRRAPRKGRPSKTNMSLEKYTEFRKKASNRERHRVNTLTEAFAKLRMLIPSLATDRGSQIETLRLAAMYIEFLLNTLSEREMYQRTLEEKMQQGNSSSSTEELTKTIKDEADNVGCRNRVIAREKLRLMFGIWRMDAELEGKKAMEEPKSSEECGFKSE